MVLNTQQLQYLVEIQRTRSISQAAANLYIGQPNLSRLLRDTEASVGFPIFERTRKGVCPTEKGAVFLQHARNILREADFMERLGPNSTHPNRFRVCLPRSYCFLEMVQQYLTSLENINGLDSVIRECHPRQALEMLSSGSAEIAVIRYGIGYQDYFSEQAEARDLSLQLLNQVEYQILVHAANPLATNTSLSKTDLEHCTELIHRDTFYPQNQNKDSHCQIYTVDRMAQLQLLRAIPNSYLWSEPLPSTMLTTNHLVQLHYAEGGALYQDAVVFKPKCAISDIELGFLHWLSEKSK